MFSLIGSALTSFRVQQLHSRAKTLVVRFKQGCGSNYIDEAVALHREALELCPPGHLMRHACLNQLAVCLNQRYQQLGVMADFEEAIVLGRDALALCPPGHLDRSMSLSNLADHLSIRYNRLGEVGDLNEAIMLCHDALILRPPGHPDRSICLNNLATYLSARFRQLGKVEDLDESIVLGRELLALRPPGHPDRSLSLNNLAVCLSKRYNHFGEMKDLDEAILLGRDALALRPPGHPLREGTLVNIAACLHARYKSRGEMDDLNEAIVLGNGVLALRPPGHPSRSMCLDNLAAYLSSRYDQLGEVEDLDRSISLGRDALADFPPGHPLRTNYLGNISGCLHTRYQQLGKVDDLNEAISLAREVLDLAPPGCPSRLKSLHNLAICLFARHMRLGEMKDLNDAIVLSQENLRLAFQQPEHPTRLVLVDNLGSCLFTRYMHFGVMEDLDEAIVRGRGVLALHLPGDPARSAYSTNLAARLSTRYKCLGSMDDLNEAITLGHESLELRPLGHPDRSLTLNNLASDLFARYKQLEGIEDLNEATAHHREALALRPLGHSARSMSLNNLASVIYARYTRLEVAENLNEAIALCSNALELDPGHPRRSMFLYNFSVYLFSRYLHLREVEDLNNAITMARGSLALCPQGHPDLSQSLDSLATYLRVRFMRTGKLEDKKEMFNLYIQMTHLPPMVSSTDLSTARAWVYVAEDFQHPTTLLAYETCLRLLTHHLAILPSLPQHRTVLKSLTSSLAVDAFSACLRYSSPTNAVVLLEQGRGVFWNQLARLRSPLDDVIASGPKGKLLADEFTQQTILIRSTFGSSDGNQHDRVCHLNVGLQKVVTKIRELPGLSNFLLPLPFSHLQQAACEGPVIIVSASSYGCDALVVLADHDPVHIPLSISKKDVRELSSKFGKFIDVTRELYICLRELWDEVVSPIVNFLQTIYPPQSRIWWCPTAEFCLLPFHAAGPFRKGQRNLVDLYVSSYTPTLTALIRARRHDPSHSVIERRHFVAIGQAKAVGQSVLPSVAIELANVGQRVEGFTVFTRVEGEDSCISRVAEELGRNEWVHLACHGIPNPQQPFESAFALHDGHFTIERIIQCEMENPQFAYLSACRTTVGDSDSPDEVIHLASAMQFAGFRSVIGTMWKADDEKANDITQVFYDNMKSTASQAGRLDHTCAAFALHKTMKTLVKIPLDQRITYIHLGA